MGSTIVGCSSTRPSTELTCVASLFKHLRLVPTSHTQPLPPRSKSINPYLPFFHIWKPAVPWSKAKWDRGSLEGLERQPPNFQAAAINARTTPLPTIHQLHEVFEESPEEVRGPPRRLGPQYRPNTAVRPNPVAELRNGDRGFIVAVNDSGNSGWIRFGRTGFADVAMI
jgi:tRNA-splicing endonuclease subunit Sen54